MKKHTGVTKNQFLTLEHIFELTQQACGEHQHVEMYHVSTWDNGTISMALKIEANENTGMLFIVDKQFLVFIGVKGGVQSQRISFDSKNKMGAKQNRFSAYA